MIKVHKLIKRFGSKTVLRGLDFDVQAGEFVALLGPNGAGKPPSCESWLLFSRPTLGTVPSCRLFPPRAGGFGPRPAGVVTHMPLLYGELSAEENLQFYGRLYGIMELNPACPGGAWFGRPYPAPARPGTHVFTRHAAAPCHRARHTTRSGSVLFDEPHTGSTRMACECSMHFYGMCLDAAERWS